MSADASVHPWEDVELGSVASITLGGTPSTEVKSFWGGDVPWMSSGEVNKRHVFDADGRITRSGLMSSNATLVDPPAVAIGLAGQGKTRGTVAMVHTRLCTNQSIALIEGSDGKLDTSYLFHNLESRYEELRSRSAGGGRAGLSRDILTKVPLPLPDISEQRRIAALLDLVDAAVAKTEAVIAKLRSIRAGLLHDLLTRGLDANGQLRDPLRHPEQFKPSPLGPIPKEWNCELLTQVTEWFSGGTPGRSQASFWFGPVPFLTPKDMKRFRLDDTHEHVSELAANAGSRLMPPDTVFIVVRGMILAHTFPVCISGRPFAFNQDMKAIRGGDRLEANYLAHWFYANADLFLRKATEATHGTKKLDMSEINRVHIALPPLPEQAAAIQRIDLADGHLTRTEGELAKLHKLKPGLMADLLTGRVRVREDCFDAAASEGEVM